MSQLYIPSKDQEIPGIVIRKVIAVCSDVEAIAFRSIKDKRTWIVRYKTTATAKCKTDVQAVITNFDITKEPVKTTAEILSEKTGLSIQEIKDALR